MVFSLFEMLQYLIALLDSIGKPQLGTVVPQLVRMRSIKLMSFSGFVLIERAYYPRGRAI